MLYALDELILTDVGGVKRLYRNIIQYTTSPANPSIIDCEIHIFPSCLYEKTPHGWTWEFKE